MPCDFDRIDALLEGSLEESARQSVLTHMDTCATCRAYYEAMQPLECDAEPSEGFAERVMDKVRATPQQKNRVIPYRRMLAGLAACAVLALGLRLFPLSESSPPAGTRSMDDPAIASDMPLTVSVLNDETLCTQVRSWLQQQEITPLYAEGLREAYDLTAEDVAALNRAIPEVNLPQQMLQLELKCGK